MSPSLSDKDKARTSDRHNNIVKYDLTLVRLSSRGTSGVHQLTFLNNMLSARTLLIEDLGVGLLLPSFAIWLTSSSGHRKGAGRIKDAWDMASNSSLTRLFCIEC